MREEASLCDEDVTEICTLCRAQRTTCPKAER